MQAGGFLIRPGQGRPHPDGMDILAIAIAVVAFALLIGSIELLDRV
jgi:hypothetical protein